MSTCKRTGTSISKVSLPVGKGNETYDVPTKETYFKQELIDKIRAHVELMSQPIARRGVYYNRPPADFTILQEKVSNRSHSCHCPAKGTTEEKMPQKEKKKMYTSKLKRMKPKTKPHKPNKTDKAGNAVNTKFVSGDDLSDSYEVNVSQSVINFEKQRQKLLVDLSQLQKELAINKIKDITDSFAINHNLKQYGRYLLNTIINLKIPKCLTKIVSHRTKLTDKYSLKMDSLTEEQASHQVTEKTFAPPPTRGIPPRPGTPLQLNRTYDPKTIFGSESERLFGKPN